MITAYSDFIQVRSGKGSEKNKVYVKGYASMPNKLDLYNYIKSPDGKTRTFKSLFTSACIEDMKEQLMNRKVFVDALHTTAYDLGIINLAKKYNFSDEDLSDVKSVLKDKKLPIAKVIGFEIDDKGLVIETETNPHFPIVDDEHKKYYEAVTGSILDGYIKGYSINFDPIDFTSENDEKGNQLDYINKVNLYGISYTDNQALVDNKFTEVCMRSLNNFMKVREMSDVKEQKSGIAQEPLKQNVQIDIDREVEKRVQEELKKQKSETELQTVKLELEQHKKLLDEIKQQREQVIQQTQKPVIPAISTVPQQDKYGQPLDNSQNVNKEGMDALMELKSEFQDYMKEINRSTPQVNGWHKNVAYGKSVNELYGKFIELDRLTGYSLKPMDGESAEDYTRRMSILRAAPDMTVSHKVKY
jgi:phage head maturation protease